MAIPMCKHAVEIRNRFGLSDGQVVAGHIYKNLWWELDGHFFGYGDLSGPNIFRIQNHLRGDETFRGWNEHHRSSQQQTDIPMIRIQLHDIMMRSDLIEEARLLRGPTDG